MTPLRSARSGAARAWRLWLAAALVSCCGLLHAQTPDIDPPGRVGRLSDVAGQVWFYDPDAGEWVGAVRNQPLTTGDHVATDAAGRTELQIGSTTLRLDGGSEIEVTVLDDQQVALDLVSGSALVKVRSGDAAREFSLTTAEGRFRAEQPGRYRFDRLDGASAATVYSGRAVYETDRSALAVEAGQRAEFWIDSAGAAQYSLTQPVRDDFVAWNDERDSRNAIPVSSPYVSPEMTGAEDLDRYGSWEQTPDYGPVWAPRVAAGWTPYSTGHWGYVRPWGWTWVDDAPWGFAPFHYGRWAYRSRGWCWVPGARVARPIYAPALVAWVGGRHGDVSVSIGGGAPAVGWFPLAPRDVYVPAYRYSPRYVREVNVPSVRDVERIHRFVELPAERREFDNRRLAHALTVVPEDVVSRRQPVAPVAAQWRNSGAGREFAASPRPAPVLAAAPVAAPIAPPRAGDARSTRPPGLVRAEAPDARRPGGRDLPAARSSADEASQRPEVRPGARPAPGLRAPVEPGIAPRPAAREQAIGARPGSADDDDRAATRPPRQRPDGDDAASSRTRPALPSADDDRRGVRRPAAASDEATGARPAPPERSLVPRTAERPSAPPSGDREERRPLPGTTNDLRMQPRPSADDRRAPAGRADGPAFDPRTDAPRGLPTNAQRADSQGRDVQREMSQRETAPRPVRTEPQREAPRVSPPEPPRELRREAPAPAREAEAARRPTPPSRTLEAPALTPPPQPRPADNPGDRRPPTRQQDR